MPMKWAFLALFASKDSPPAGVANFILAIEIAAQFGRQFITLLGAAAARWLKTRHFYTGSTPKITHLIAVERQPPARVKRPSEVPPTLSTQTSATESRDHDPGPLTYPGMLRLKRKYEPATTIGIRSDSLRRMVEPPPSELS
jgi:hypothetical protein